MPNKDGVVLDDGDDGDEPSIDGAPGAGADGGGIGVGGVGFFLLHAATASRSTRADTTLSH